MQKHIIFQTQQRINLLLDTTQGKNNLEKLKRARYMRDDYLTRKKRLNVTFEKADFEALKREAEHVGLTPTAFLRESVFSYLKHCRLPSQASEHVFSELVFLLRNMANNLNQIARQANTVQKLSLHELVKTKATLEQLEDTAEAFMKRL